MTKMVWCQDGHIKQCLLYWKGVEIDLIVHFPNMLNFAVNTVVDQLVFYCDGCGGVAVRVSTLQ